MANSYLDHLVNTANEVISLICAAKTTHLCCALVRLMLDQITSELMNSVQCIYDQITKDT